MNHIGKDILQDILQEIKQYNIINKGKTPSYIIVNEKDSEMLLKAMFEAKLIPDTNPPKKIVLLS